jgi:arginine-tRNA-protein transferase
LASFSHFPAWPVPFGLDLPFEEELVCPYLPGQMARYRAVGVETLPASYYHQFMDAGFRRSGHVLYQPACRNCRACVPLRVETVGFAPNASQRRCRRRNADLLVEAGVPIATTEKLALYNRYNTGWHAGTPLTLARFAEAFYESCVETIEFAYRASDGELLAVGLCDVAPESLSSVYFYFAPEAAARGLGTYGALCEIDFALRQGIPHYYLGYWVAECGAMSYKANFGPYELLGTDGIWEPALGERRSSGVD